MVMRFSGEIAESAEKSEMQISTVPVCLPAWLCILGGFSSRPLR